MTNTPNGRSVYGIPILPDSTIGKIWGTRFFVDAAADSDGYTGKDLLHPLKTIQAALDKCTASKGDTVYVRNGAYAETLTMTKAGVRLIGESHGVVITGATDATDTLVISGNNCEVENVSIAGYDTGDDISLIKVTGNECIIKNCYFTEANGEYQLEGNTADEMIVVGCRFTSPHDVTNGACIFLEDSDRCIVASNTFFVATASDGIILHDADDTFIIGNYAIGSHTAAAGAGSFVLIADGDAGMRLMVANNMATLWAGGITEVGAAIACHGLGTGDLPTTATVDTDIEQNACFFGNDFLGCTLAFDTAE